MFNDAVLPIYSYDEDTKQPKAVGSGTLLFFDGRVVLVSAAHVFRETLGRPFVIGAWDKLATIWKHPAMLSSYDPGVRTLADDPLDIGAMILPNPVVDYINGRVKLVEPEYVSSTNARAPAAFHQVIGYPGSTNTRGISRARGPNVVPYRPQCLIYSVLDVTDKYNGSEGFDSRGHVALEFSSKDNVDDDGNKVNIPKLKGISGGLLQAVHFYVPHSEGRYPTSAAGIVLRGDRSKRILIAVRLEVVYEWLKEKIPALSQKSSGTVVLKGRTIQGT